MLLVCCVLLPDLVLLPLPLLLRLLVPVPLLLSLLPFPLMLLALLLLLSALIFLSPFLSPFLRRLLLGLGLDIPDLFTSSCVLPEDPCWLVVPEQQTASLLICVNCAGFLLLCADCGLNRY
jgi:hypothetical protein